MPNSPAYSSLYPKKIPRKFVFCGNYEKNSRKICENDREAPNINLAVHHFWGFISLALGGVFFLGVCCGVYAAGGCVWWWVWRVVAWWVGVGVRGLDGCLLLPLALPVVGAWWWGVLALSVRVVGRWLGWGRCWGNKKRRF
jgi:hypothetical protein